MPLAVTVLHLSPSLEPLFSVSYAWNMPGVYHVYVDVLHIHGIYMVYPWIYHVYPSDWIYMVYPCIYHVYPPSIYMVHPWIYMVYHLMYIHGIYVVYHGISLDVYTWYIRGISWYIHGYSKLSETRFRGRPVLLVSFNAHTHVGNDQECFIPRATMANAPGGKAAHKRLNPTAANVPRLSLVAAHKNTRVLQKRGR